MADSLRKRFYIVVWIGVSECNTSRVKEILTIDERVDAFVKWLFNQFGFPSPKKITPPEAFRRVERGENTTNEYI